MHQHNLAVATPTEYLHRQQPNADGDRDICGVEDRPMPDIDINEVNDPSGTQPVTEVPKGPADYQPQSGGPPRGPGQAAGKSVRQYYHTHSSACSSEDPALADEVERRASVVFKAELEQSVIRDGHAELEVSLGSGLGGLVEAESSEGNGDKQKERASPLGDRPHR